MSNVRVNQRLTETYNPDGTPGTVSTGPPGPAPTSDQVLTAVTQYLTTNPVQASTADTGAQENNLFGGGATGAPGTWINVGTQGTLDGYLTVGSTTTNANLILAPYNNGQITLRGSVEITGMVSFDDDLRLNDQPVYLRAPGVNTHFIGYDATTNGTRVLGTSWAIGSPDVQLAQVGTGSTATVDVTDPTGVTYHAIRASAFTVTSDRSLKDFIQPLVGGLAEVLTTQPYSYRMNGEWRRGLIADEAPLGVLHEGVGELKMLDLYALVTTLWSALREMNDRVMEMGQCSRFRPTE